MTTLLFLLFVVPLLTMALVGCATTVPTPYIPTKDSAVDSWATNFATLITASPATYGLDATAALAIQTARDSFHAAYLLGGSTGTPPHPVNPTTFTRVTVASKNAEKIAMLGLVRSYAAQIRLNPGVTNADKTALGLNLPNNTPTPIATPTTFPLLAIAGAGPGQHEIRYADNTTPASRKKPAGAIQMELYRGVAVAAITDPTLTSLLGLVTKQPYQSIFSNPADAGKIATYFARWVTRTGKVGPWSAAVSMTVAF